MTIDHNLILLLAAFLVPLFQKNPLGALLFLVLMAVCLLP
jgi:hypothetical protein